MRQIAPLPAWVVLLTGLFFNGLLIGVGVLTMPLRHATGDIVLGDSKFCNLFSLRSQPAAQRLRWFQTNGCRERHLAFITTAQAGLVAERIRRETGCFVTPLSSADQPLSLLVFPFDAAQVSALNAVTEEIFGNNRWRANPKRSPVSALRSWSAPPLLRPG